MAKINPNDPAFPFVNQEGDSLQDREVKRGLSIRAELAARAMQGILSNLQDWNEEEPNNRNSVAEWSVKYADALIEELNKTASDAAHKE